MAKGKYKRVKVNGNSKLKAFNRAVRMLAKYTNITQDAALDVIVKSIPR